MIKKVNMKVLIYGHKIFSVDMLWGFKQAGCDTVIINPATVLEMEKILEENNPDLLLTLGPPLEHNREAMEYIGKRAPTSMKYIHWDTDGISSTYFQSVTGEGIEMDLIHLSKPDLVLTMCPEMLEFIRKRNYPCEMMYYAYSPVSHHPMAGYDNDKYYINLIGNSYYLIANFYPQHYRYTSIKILLKPLLENGYEIHFYGDNGYKPLIKKLLDIDVAANYFHGYLPYEKTCAAYNSSFINLVTQNHDNTITKRTFEILGSGGFIFSSDNSELRKLFVPGRDLAVSSSPEQTLELAHYYKDHPDEWRKVRENAVLSVKNHTYKQRAEYIIEKYMQL
jgi:spore maturation protein CgeB